MNRLQKKCVLGSTLFHGVVLTITITGMGFLGAKKESEIDPVHMVNVADAILTEGLNKVGGTKDAAASAPTADSKAPQRPEVIEPKVETKEPPAPPEKTVEEPLPPTPPPPPAKEETREKVEEPKVETKEEKVLVPEDEKPKVKDTPKTTPKKEFSLDSLKTIPQKDLVKRMAKADTGTAKNNAAAEDARKKAIETGIANTLGKLNRGFTSGSKIEPLGPGGQAFMDYGEFVKRRYEEAWLEPTEANKKVTSVIVSVTIERSGRVLESKIIGPSGDRPVDASIQKMLKDVKDIGRPFPKESKDAKKTFKIRFNLREEGI